MCVLLCKLTVPKIRMALLDPARPCRQAMEILSISEKYGNEWHDDVDRYLEVLDSMNPNVWTCTEMTRLHVHRGKMIVTILLICSRLARPIPVGRYVVSQTGTYASPAPAAASSLDPKVRQKERKWYDFPPTFPVNSAFESLAGQATKPASFLNYTVR